jgi:hypothetical protein
MGRVGIEPTTHGFSVHSHGNVSVESGGDNKIDEKSFPPDLPVNSQSDADLAELTRAWPTLSPTKKRVIIGIAKGK